MTSTEHAPTIIIPVKAPDRGKSRLAPVLGARSRHALSLMLLQHVLRCTGDAQAPLHRWVVGGDRWVRRVAESEGARWLEELGTDLNDTLGRAMCRAFAGGSPAVVFLPADLPLLEPPDIDALMDATSGFSRIVMCPALNDGGTNALAMPRSMAFPLRLGTHSFARHLEAANSLGHLNTVLRREGFAFDLDTPAELQRCQATLPAFDEGLARWEAILEEAAEHSRLQG